MEQFDVIVVGSGAGGAAAAWAYATLGKKVCIIERGEWSLRESFPANFENWEELKNTVYSYDPNIRLRDSDYQIDNSHSSIRVANYNGVGGSTILFSGHFPRMHPSDFRTRTLDNVGQDWPLSYSMLEPFYDLNDKNMNTAGLLGDPAYPSMKFLKKPLSIGSYGNTLGAAFNKLGWHWWPSYSAISTTNGSADTICQSFGPCNTGCPSGAKSSVDLTYVKKAIDLGAKLITSASVFDLLVRDGEVFGVIALKKNKKFRIYGNLVVLACNAIGTSRLLMHHLSKYAPEQAPNTSPLLGKNLMMHPLGFAEATLPHETDCTIGPQGCCIYSHEFYETRNSNKFSRGYTMQILRAGGGIEAAIRGMDRGEVNWGASLVKDFIKFRNRYASMAIICEDLPDTHNTVYLTNKIDRDGLPIVGVKYSLSENTKKMLSHGLTSAKQVLKAAGGKRIQVSAPVADAGWHLMGTARMGHDRQSAVSSHIGEFFGIKKLFVADGSLFVTSGGVNPASTIQALALYVANESSKKYFNSADLLNAAV